MFSKRKSTLLLLLIGAIISVSIIFCSGEKSATLFFVDIRGNDLNASDGINVNEPLFFRLEGLLVNEFYRVRVLDDAGERVFSEDLIYVSDDEGKLPASPLAFLGEEAAQITSSKIASSVVAPVQNRSISPGQWCVNVYRYRGGSVTGKKCINLTEKSKVAFTTDSDGNPNKSFLINVGNVYVSGTNFTPSSNVDIYIQFNSNVFLGDQEEIVDSRGQDAATFSVNDSGEFSGILWAAPSELGQYDVIVDVDQDGKFDLGSDYISSPGFLPGFTVQSKTIPTIQNFAQLACGELGDAYCAHKDFFVDEDVYVLLTPLTQPAKSFDIPAPKVHIVQHADTYAGGEELSTVLPEVGKFPVQTGTYSGAKVLVIPKGLMQPGCYDVIADTDLNERYDIGQDFLDNSNIENEAVCGFSIPGGEGAPSVTISGATDGKAATVTDGGNTTATTLSLSGTVSASSDIIASYVSVETDTEFNQLSFTTTGGAIDTGFFPIFDGTNRVTIFIMDSDKKVGYARFTLTSDQSAVTRNIEIELSWSVPTGATTYDLDLHFVRPGGTYFGGNDVFDVPVDCYWSTCRLSETGGQGIDWGADGGDEESANNPKQLIDCISSCVRVEKIFMEEVDVIGDYGIYVDAFNGKGEPTVKIYINGELDSTHTAPCNSGVLESGTDYDSWYVGKFIKGPGSLTFDNATPATDCFDPEA